MFEHLDQARFIEWRVRVRRAYQAGDAARDSGLHLAFQRGLVFITRFAQTRGKIDQARADDFSVRINGAVGMEISRHGTDGDYFSSGDKYIALSINFIFWINQPTIFNMYFHCA